MKIIGSKEIIADDILPFIHNYMMLYNIDTYIEPFVGGANIIDKVVANKKYGYDTNKYLIALFNYIKAGGKLPEEISVEQYIDCKAHYKANDGTYKDWFIGAVAFMADMRGKFFDTKGGTSGLTEVERYNKHYAEAVEEMIKQSRFISDIEFINAEYGSIRANNCLIYCEVPDDDKHKKKGFDIANFWYTVSKWNDDNNIVFIRSKSAPDEYDIIWENENNSKCDKVYVHRKFNMNRKETKKYDF